MPNLSQFDKQNSGDVRLENFEVPREAPRTHLGRSEGKPSVDVQSVALQVLVLQDRRFVRVGVTGSQEVNEQRILTRK